MPQEGIEPPTRRLQGDSSTKLSYYGVVNTKSPMTSLPEGSSDFKTWRRKSDLNRRSSVNETDEIDQASPFRDDLRFGVTPCYWLLLGENS